MGAETVRLSAGGAFFYLNFAPNTPLQEKHNVGYL